MNLVLSPARVRALVAAAAVTLLLAGCAGEADLAADPVAQADIAAAPDDRDAPESALAAPSRVVALDIDDTAGVVRVATDRGVYVAPLPEGDEAATAATLLGDRDDAIKSYLRVGSQLLVSGHPSGDDAERLGLWAGDSETGEWVPVSLAGEVDFHAITAAGPTAADAFVAAADAASNTLYYSPDGGESWQKGATIGATGLAFAGDGSALVAVTPVGVKVSTDRGRTFAEPEGAPALQLVATPPVGTKEWRIVGVDSAGALWRSIDGQQWEQFGSLAAVPSALALGKSGEVIYVATTDGVFVSNDGGETLTLMLDLGW